MPIIVHQQRGVCKDCKRELIIDHHADGSVAAHHEAPLCAPYEQLLRETEASPTGMTIVGSPASS